MNQIKTNIDKLTSSLPSGVKLVAVSKTHPASAINEAFKAGQIHFGENKVQEMCNKHEDLKNDEIKWHLIGHLQTNKVKNIASFVEMIHSVDSLRILIEINKQAKKNNRTINCLLQFYIASEETKFGLDYIEAKNILDSDEYKNLKNIKICGVMGMASFTDSSDVIRTEFRNLKDIFNNLKKDYFTDSTDFCELSMGMSSDWELAIEEGSTIIRVGSMIFGQRNYNVK